MNTFSRWCRGDSVGKDVFRRRVGSTARVLGLVAVVVAQGSCGLVLGLEDGELRPGLCQNGTANRDAPMFETGVDCGGNCPSRCGTCQGCEQSSDCASSLCVHGRCRPLGTGPVTFEAKNVSLHHQPAGAVSIPRSADDPVAERMSELFVLNAGTNTLSMLFPYASRVLPRAHHVELGAGITGKPASIVSGDFDNDGLVDLAVSYPDDEKVQISFRADRTDPSNDVPYDGALPTFDEPQVYAVGGKPRAIAVSDLDQDGIADLVVAGDQLNTLLSRGDRTFLTTRTTGAGPAIQAVAVADFDGDKNPDVAVATAASTALQVLAGDKTGGFGPLATVSGLEPTVAIAAADLDGDGSIDLALAHSQTVSILLNDGTGLFDSEPVAVSLELSNPTSILSEDLNGDNRIDLALAGAEGELVVLLATGAAEYGAGQTLDGISSATALSTGDLDADGVRDLVVTNQADNTTTVLFGQGDGGFDPPVRTGVGRDFVGFPRGRSLLSSTLRTLTLLDVEYEQEVLSVRWVGMLNLDFEPGAATFFDGPSEGTENDLLITNRTDASFSSFVTDGPSTYHLGETFGAANNPVWIGVVQNDAVVVLNRESNVAQLRQRSESTLGSVIQWEVGAGPVSLANGDLDQEENLDFVVANQDGNSVSVALRSWDNNVTSKGEYPTGNGPVSVLIEDLNHDLVGDVVTANSGDGTLSVLLGNGDGTLGSALSIPVVTTSIPQEGLSMSVASEDFNLDGQLDVVATNNEDGDVYVLLGRGDGTFDLQEPLRVGGKLMGLGVIDEGDECVPDVRFADRENGSITFLINRTPAEGL